MADVTPPEDFVDDLPRMRRALVAFVAVPIAWILWGLFGTRLTLLFLGQEAYFFFTFLIPFAGAVVLSSGQKAWWEKALVFLTTFVGYLVFGYLFVMAIVSLSGP